TFLSCFFFFSSTRRHTRFSRDWSSDVCSSDLRKPQHLRQQRQGAGPHQRPPQGLHATQDDVKQHLNGPCETKVARADEVVQVGRSEERRVGKEGRARG